MLKTISPDFNIKEAIMNTIKSHIIFISLSKAMHNQNYYVTSYNIAKHKQS